MQIIRSKIYDFSDPLIQGRLEEAYEKARNKFIDNENGNYVKGSLVPDSELVAHFDRKCGNIYNFRISDFFMDRMISIAQADNQVWGENGLFQ